MFRQRSTIHALILKYPKMFVVLLAALPLMICMGWLLALSQGDLPGMVRCAACRFKAAMMPGSDQSSC